MTRLTPRAAVVLVALLASTGVAGAADPGISELSADAAARYERLLDRIGANPGRRPTIDDATGRGAGAIRRADDGDLANGLYTVAISYASEVLEEGTLTLACPP
ncbi:MAG: hypothetical protein ACRDPC_27665 [Solirubrobacteraceae bacterium]